MYKLRATRTPKHASLSHTLIDNCIKRGKRCSFELQNVDAEMVEEMLLHLSDEASPGIDNVDGILLKVVARELCVPVCHIFNTCLTNSSCPALWKEVIPLQKNKKATFSGRPYYQSITSTEQDIGKDCFFIKFKTILLIMNL